MLHEKTNCPYNLHIKITFFISAQMTRNQNKKVDIWYIAEKNVVVICCCFIFSDSILLELLKTWTRILNSVMVFLNSYNEDNLSSFHSPVIILKVRLVSAFLLFPSFLFLQGGWNMDSFCLDTGMIKKKQTRHTNILIRLKN